MFESFICRLQCGERKENNLKWTRLHWQLTVTWYGIRHAGKQAMHWDIQNKENSNFNNWM